MFSLLLFVLSVSIKPFFFFTIRLLKTVYNIIVLQNKLKPLKKVKVTKESLS